MQNKIQKNIVSLFGEIISEWEYDHETMNERFGRVSFRIERQSGTSDVLPLMVSEKFLEVGDIKVGTFATVNGAFRSYNTQDEAGKSHLVVARVDGHDRIVSGHRRREAALLNKRRGYEEFNEVNCMMREMTQNMFMITLASANAFTRKLTDFELIKQAEILRTYYQKAKEEDGLEIKGKMRDFLAAQLGVSKTKMAQIDAINNNLSEEGKQALEAGNINFSKAYETSKLPPEQQQEVIKNRTLLSQDVKDLAQQNRKAANISFQMKEETDCVEEETFTMPLKKTVEKNTPNFVDRNWERMTFTDYQFYKHAIKKLEEVHPEFLSMK